jgi:RecJ-like exonuclease
MRSGRGALNPDPNSFWEAARDMAEFLLRSDRVEIVAHIDADGITSASIASTALERAGIDHEVGFVKKLDPPEIERVNRRDCDALWLVDLGSGAYIHLKHPGLCVSDHHVPDCDEGERVGQCDLFIFTKRHLNPRLFGIDGSTELSGAGTTYSVAKMMDPDNVDLSAIALVGAVGDFQDSAQCKLVGFNRNILADAEEAGVATGSPDIRLFGRETRPLDRLLQFSTDPYLPGLTNNERECRQFIVEMGIDLKRDGKWRRWIDLQQEERVTLASNLCHLLLDSGRGSEAVRRLIGETYLLTKEEEGTELHDAKEFSTLLNSCGRYGFAAVGMQVCKGDRGQSLETALRLQRDHRGNLCEAIELVNDIGMERREYLQQFNAGDRILDSIVGIVAGMALGSGELDQTRPIIAFANSEDGKVKVSARSTKELVRGGLDLAIAVKEASEKIGGNGGGHNIAARATIDEGMEEDFLDEMKRIIARQIGPRPEA